MHILYIHMYINIVYHYFNRYININADCILKIQYYIVGPYCCTWICMCANDIYASPYLKSPTVDKFCNGVYTSRAMLFTNNNDVCNSVMNLRVCKCIYTFDTQLQRQNIWTSTYTYVFPCIPISRRNGNTSALASSPPSPSSCLRILDLLIPYRKNLNPGLSIVNISSVCSLCYTT